MPNPQDVPPDSSPGFDRADATIAALLAIATAVPLLAARAIQMTPDSLGYALDATTGENLFHPHHLLFSLAVRGVWLPLSRFGADGILAGQVHNLLWASIAIAATYLGVRQLSGSRAIGVGAALLLLSCHGFLFQATQVETYVPATGCATLIVLELCRSLTKRQPLRRAWLTALIALLVLYHQTGVLLAVPLLAMAATSGDATWRRHATQSLLLAGVLVLVTYTAVYVHGAQSPSLGGFVEFCLRYAVSPRLHWGSFDHFSADGLERLWQRQVWNAILIEAPAPAPVAALLLFVLGVAAWNLDGVIRRRPPVGLRLFFLTWIVVHCVFFLWWLPGEREFFTVSLLPLVWLTVLSVADLPARQHAIAGCTVAALGLTLLPYHVSQSLLPASRTRAPTYDRTRQLLEAVPPGCTILTTYPELRTMRYYFGRDQDEVMSVRRWKLELFTHEDPAGLPPLDEKSCVVAPWTALNPASSPVRGHPEFSGVDQPVGFWRFLRWVLRVEGGLLSDPIEAPPLTSFRDESGALYVVSGPGDLIREPREDFFRRLDDLRGDAPDGPFTTWWRTVSQATP